MAADRQHAHELLDRLDSGQFAAIANLLEVMADPLGRSLSSVPPDDEPLTEQETAALEASKDWFRRNPGIPHEQILREFGLDLQSR